MNISFSIMSLLVHSENIYPSLNNIHLSFNQALSVPLHFFLNSVSNLLLCTRSIQVLHAGVTEGERVEGGGGMVSLKHMKSVPASEHLMF